MCHCREIRYRVELLMDESDKTGSLAYLNIRTFDSFAIGFIAASEEPTTRPRKCSRVI